MLISVYVLGIDAGGTKTVCLLADGHGHVLAEGRGGGANLQTELEVEKVLYEVIEQAVGQRDDRPAAIGIGMAGVDRPEDTRVVRAIMRRLGYGRTPLLVVNDALVALVAGASMKSGVVVISGTGSIVYGRNDVNRAARSGGWGHRLGDEGSGYWIALSALKAVLQHTDGRGRATALSQAVFETFNMDAAGSLIHLAYPRDLEPDTIAKLCGIVERAAEAGDEVALGLVWAARDELMAGAASVTKRLGLEDEAFPFVLAGGVFRGVPRLAVELSRCLPTIAPKSSVKMLEVEPAVGAVRLALAESRGEAHLPRYL